jgi:DeoR/GlpR family transcriptional regulator of sugar metabolism
MLASQRQAIILEQVRLQGAVRVSDLTDMLGVSDMTIRRDLDALARRGGIEKVHGGATLVGMSSAAEPGFEMKSQREQPEKDGIAGRAATLVAPGSAIGVGAGTTTWALTRLLVDVPNLTVVTNSIPVADMLHRAKRSDQTVVLTGGIRTRSDALVGPVAVSVIRSLHLDLLFLGTHGMDERGGLTSPNLMEAETNRAFIEAARRLCVVADHTKWGVVGLSSFARLDEVDVLVTDSGIDDAARSVLEEAVGQLVVTELADSEQNAG